MDVPRGPPELALALVVAAAAAVVVKNLAPKALNSTSESGSLSSLYVDFLVDMNARDTGPKQRVLLVRSIQHAARSTDARKER